MTNRSIRTKVNDAVSGDFKCELGVPQGSVLGPLLFNIFINDLPQHISCGKLIIYADDTSVVIAAKNSDELMVKVNLVLHEFSTWCTKNGLIINVKKTKCIFSTK